MKKSLFAVICFVFFVCACHKPVDTNGNTGQQEQKVENTQGQDNAIIDPQVLFESGKTKFQNNDFKGAIADFTESLKMREVHHVRADLGRAKEAVGDFKGALEDYTKAIEQEKRGVYYLWRSELYTKLGETEEAAKDRAKFEKLPKE